MNYTYWLVKQGNIIRLHEWIDENYPGINFWVDDIAILASMYKANYNTNSIRFQNCTRASVIWFEHFDEPDVNVKFKLMNSDIILDHKYEEPKDIW